MSKPRDVTSTLLRRETILRRELDQLSAKVADAERKLQQARNRQTRVASAERLFNRFRQMKKRKIEQIAKLRLQIEEAE